MPRLASRPRVPRITLEIVRRAFRDRPGPGENDFYILEKNDCPCLRVRRTVVQLGVRVESRFHLAAQVDPNMSIEEIELARGEARRLWRRLQDEQEMPGLARGRSMTLQSLYLEYLADFKENRSSTRSPRTLEAYEALWRLHLLPTLGHLRVAEITPETVRNFKKEMPVRVSTQHHGALTGGRTVTNRAMQQLNAALSFALRLGWISRNPASSWIVQRFDERPSPKYLDAQACSAVGRVLRDFEERCLLGKQCPVSLRSLYALRVALYTGVRHRTELLWTRLDWCHLDSEVPRIGIPRAKGNRREGGGRWIFLGPEAVRLIKEIPRPTGSEHLTVPGRRPGRPLFCLTKTFRAVLSEAGVSQMPVNALRHTFSTHAVGVIAPEHRAQLLGHRGQTMTDTVYLHHHGPDLARAANLVEHRFRDLLGDLSAEREAVTA